MPARVVDPKIIVELQETPDPDTGRLRSADVIRGILKREYGVEMSRAGVRQAAIRYRTRNGLAPPPCDNDQGFPSQWGTLPDSVHQNDQTAYALHRIARRERARSNGAEVTLHPSELRAVESLERLLARMGERTVVARDPEANNGDGGWVLRQMVPGEEVWYGVMAVRPYP